MMSYWHAIMYTWRYFDEDVSDSLPKRREREKHVCGASRRRRGKGWTHHCPHRFRSTGFRSAFGVSRAIPVNRDGRQAIADLIAWHGEQYNTSDTAGSNVSISSRRTDSLVCLSGFWIFAHPDSRSNYPQLGRKRLHVHRLLPRGHALPNLIHFGLRVQTQIG